MEDLVLLDRKTPVVEEKVRADTAKLKEAEDKVRLKQVLGKNK